MYLLNVYLHTTNVVLVYIQNAVSNLQISKLLSQKRNYVIMIAEQHVDCPQFGKIILSVFRFNFISEFYCMSTICFNSDQVQSVSHQNIWSCNCLLYRVFKKEGEKVKGYYTTKKIDSRGCLGVHCDCNYGTFDKLHQTSQKFHF